MPNTTNRKNLKAVIDILSDGHQEVAMKAADVNRVLLDLDERSNSGAGVGLSLRASIRHLGELEEHLEAQEARARRVRDEISEIRKNLRVF